jgi:hypothetical protein
MAGTRISVGARRVGHALALCLAQITLSGRDSSQIALPTDFAKPPTDWTLELR